MTSCPLASIRVLVVVVLLLLIFSVGPVHCSVGDNDRNYHSCIGSCYLHNKKNAQCPKSSSLSPPATAVMDSFMMFFSGGINVTRPPMNATYHVSEYNMPLDKKGNTMKKTKASAFSVEEKDRLYSLPTAPWWDCYYYCKFHCVELMSIERNLRNLDVVKFHGHWPFKRLLGLEEPMAVLFSMMNALPHFYRIYRDNFSGKYQEYQQRHTGGDNVGDEFNMHSSRMSSKLAMNGEEVFDFT